MSTPASMAPVVQHAESYLAATLVGIGNPDTRYLRAFRTASGRELALARTAQQLYLWSAPVWERASTELRALRKKRYAPDEARIHTLQANAPSLYLVEAADYWHFPTLGALKDFITWYRTL